MRQAVRILALTPVAFQFPWTTVHVLLLWYAGRLASRGAWVTLWYAASLWAYCYLQFFEGR